MGARWGHGQYPEDAIPKYIFLTTCLALFAVNPGAGVLAEMFEAIAAVDDAGVHQRGWPPGLQPRRLRRGVCGIRALFRSHGPRI